MNWIKLAYAAASLAVEEWAESRARAAAARRAGDEFRRQLGGRSPVTIECGRCSRPVRADLRSMAEHRCPPGAA